MQILSIAKDSKIAKDDECCACLPIILLHSIVVNADKKCYPQMFLEECKYAAKKKKAVYIINEELELEKSDESDEDQNSANRDKNKYEQ